MPTEPTEAPGRSRFMLASVLQCTELLGRNESPKLYTHSETAHVNLSNTNSSSPLLSCLLSPYVCLSGRGLCDVDLCPCRHNRHRSHVAPVPLPTFGLTVLTAWLPQPLSTQICTLSGSLIVLYMALHSPEAVSPSQHWPVPQGIIWLPAMFPGTVSGSFC